MTLNKKAVIFGIKGLELTKNEIKLFKKIKPWGIILFSRNIKNIGQLKKLTNNIRKIFKTKKYPILIDQEGGKVSRLNKIIDLSYFSQQYFGNLHKTNKNFFLYYSIYIKAISALLNEVGININTVPVLDVERKNAHSVIGSRSFSKNVNKVIKIGRFCIKEFKKNKIASVIKHIPGHGSSKHDSHFNTPIIKNNKKILSSIDFKPFKFCKSFFAMTAHAIYPTYDSINTCTHSKIIINKIIRKNINFKGILISDDISMKSLKFSLEQNAIKAIKAGCNIILHCNGNIKEMSRLSKAIPKIDKFTQKKTSQFIKFLG
jgi:beta-N-acetylhexosaminidase